MARITIGCTCRTHENRPLRKPSETHRQRSLLRREARYSMHLRPQANKMRNAAFCEMASARRVLNNYRSDKTRITRIESEGPRHIADKMFINRVRLSGGAAAYLKDLLSYASYYLKSASSFGKHADGVVLP